MPGPEETSFLDALAARSVAPAGGAAAAYAGAMAAALVAMVARTTVDKRGYEPVKERMAAIISAAEACRALLTEGVNRDSSAYQAMIAARRLPRTVKNQQVVEKAKLRTVEAPAEIAHAAYEVLKLAAELLATGNRNALSDVTCAILLAEAAITVSVENARLNMEVLPDNAQARILSQQLDEIVDGVEAVQARPEAAIQAGEQGEASSDDRR